MADKRYCKAIKGDFLDPLFNDKISRLCNFMRQRHGLKPFKDSHEITKNLHLFFLFSDVGLTIQISTIKELHLNFISVFTSSDELLKDTLDFVEKECDVYTHEELLNHAKQDLQEKPTWLPVLVKGSITDFEVKEEIVALIREHLGSSNPEIQKWAVVAACIDEVYYHVFKETIVAMGETELPKETKDLIKKINIATKRPAVGGLIF